MTTRLFYVFYVLASPPLFLHFWIMNILEKVRQWFDQDCPYLPGVALYRQTGGAYPIHIFEGYEQANFVPQDLEQRLQYALSLFLQNHPSEKITSEEKEVEQPQKRTIVQNLEVDLTVDQEPEVIQQLRAKARSLHKRHAHLKAQLPLGETPADRYQIAFEIMENIIPSLDEIYDQIRDWQATGTLPEAPPSDEVQLAIQDTIKKMNRRGTLASRISLLKRKLQKKLKDGQQQKYQKELLDKQVELQQIEEALSL